jgi:hypothetical protein
MNELDTLLADSLRQLSDEFQQREKQLLLSFAQQSSKLRQEQDELLQRLDKLTVNYHAMTDFLQRVVTLLQALDKRLGR